MYRTSQTIAALAACLAVSLTAAPTRAAISNSDSILIVNPSFQEPSPHAGGYGNNTGWDTSGTTAGVNNNVADPFGTGTNPPHDNQMGFVQNVGSLTQSGLTGFDTSATYWVQVFYAKRGATDDADLHVSVAGSEVAAVSGISNDGTVSFDVVTALFTPAAASGDLVFTNGAPADNTVLFDAISVIKRTAQDVVILNPSFEASVPITGVDLQADVPLAGWTSTPNSGIQRDNGTFFDGLDGGTPDGEQYAYVQGGGTTLSQTIDGLDVGQKYAIQYMYKARGEENVAFDDPNLITTIGGIEVHNELLIADEDADFAIHTASFFANAASMDLVFFQSVVGDATVFIDNVSIRAIPTPAALPVGLGMMMMLAARRRR